MRVVHDTSQNMVMIHTDGVRMGLTPEAAITLGENLLSAGTKGVLNKPGRTL